MAFKFAHTADVHIKKNGDAGFTALAEILQKSKDKNVTALFITGDLFEDDKYAFEVRHNIRELFEKYPEIGIFLSPGNHDEESYDKSINYGSNVEILSLKPYERNESLEGFTIYSIPFQRGKSISAVIKKISEDSKKLKKFPIVLSHGTLIDESLKHILIYMSQYEEENESFYIYGEDFTKSDIPLVLIGHYHDHTEKKYGKTTITYSGAPTPTSIRNSGKRRATLIEADPKKKEVKLKSIFLSSSYNITKILKSIPSKEDNLFSDLENILKDSEDPTANIEIKIEGYISTEEKAFQESLDKIKDEYKSKFKKLILKNATRQISSLKQYPLVEQFLAKWEAKLEKSSKDEKQTEVYLKALEFALDAFEESFIKKKNK